MERITFEGNFCDISMCRENPCPYNGMCSQRQTWERLKEYEETGLDPDEIRWMGDLRELKREIIFGVTAERLKELAEADKNGRLVVLPCNVGEYWRDWNGDRVQICSISYMTSKGLPICCDSVVYRYDEDGDDFSVNWIYFKSHFTREEADAELAVKGGNG